MGCFKSIEILQTIDNELTGTKNNQHDFGAIFIMTEQLEQTRFDAKACRLAITRSLNMAITCIYFSVAIARQHFEVCLREACQAR